MVRGVMRADDETIEVTDGQLDITFLANSENPQNNALEILPAARVARQRERCVGIRIYARRRAW